MFGVLLPTVITVACFIGFLICWFRFRSAKRNHVTHRKSSFDTCSRRHRVYIASSSTTTDVSSFGGCRTTSCFRPPTGSRIPVGWVTHVTDRRSSSVLFPLPKDRINVDVPSTATAEVGCFEMSMKYCDRRPRRTSGLRLSTTSPALPGLLISQLDRRPVSGTLVRTATAHCDLNSTKFEPEIPRSEPRKKDGRLAARAESVDACYVEVEPAVHASGGPTTSYRRSRISGSRSIDGAVSTATKPQPITSGLSRDRTWHWTSEQISKTYEVPRLAQTRRHHSLAEVLHHGGLQIKAADQTSLDF